MTYSNTLTNGTSENIWGYCRKCSKPIFTEVTRHGATTTYTPKWSCGCFTNFGVQAVKVPNQQFDSIPPIGVPDIQPNKASEGVSEDTKRSIEYLVSKIEETKFLKDAEEQAHKKTPGNSEIDIIKYEIEKLKEKIAGLEAELSALRLKKMTSPTGDLANGSGFVNNRCPCCIKY